MPPSGRSCKASSVASKCAILPARLISSPVKRCAKISPILPIDTFFRDAAVARVAFKRARDDAADIERIAEAPRNAAEIIKPLAPKDRFMRSELQNRIGGGVADRCTALDMVGAETLDDFDSRGMTIAENAGKPSLGDQRIGELRWKARL